MTAGNVALMEFLLRGHGSGMVRLVGFSGDEGFRYCRQHRDSSF